MLSPPNFCSVRPFAISATSHLTAGKVSVQPCSGARMKPRRRSSEALRGTESFLVCQMAKPPTSVQLSRLCQPNPPASQGSGALTFRASLRG